MRPERAKTLRHWRQEATTTACPFIALCRECVCKAATRQATMHCSCIMYQIRLLIMHATSAGTGKGGTSIYGGHFKDEIHPSLGHRGEYMTPHSSPFLFAGSSKRLLMLHHGSIKALLWCVCSAECHPAYQVCNCQFSSSSDPHKCKETLTFQRHARTLQIC
jgi:hypothetical protein